MGGKMKKIIGLVLICLLLTIPVMAYGYRKLTFKVRPDLNEDGCVDMDDFGILANCYGEYDMKCDFNKDGIINDRDKSIWIGFYNMGCT